jgi:hypothetical protein
MPGPSPMPSSPVVFTVNGDCIQPPSGCKLLRALASLSHHPGHLGTGGYAIPVDSGVQLKPLPWMNIDQVKVVFSEDVVIDSSDLVLAGVNAATYAVSSFNHAPATFTATWTLSAAIGADKLLIALNADGPDPIRDAAGNALDGE